MDSPPRTPPTGKIRDVLTSIGHHIEEREGTPDMATQSFLEIEAKFAVDMSTPLPDLTSAVGIASVASEEHHELSAVYYDTEDLRLTRAKITLRRRTGGNDAGWHIKLPGSTGRKEIRAALDDAAGEPQVPAELLAELRSIVRALPLKPIAQVDNQRTEITYANAEGTPVAEFCDDHVTARSFLPAGRETRWREWEVELTEGVSGTEDGNALLAAASEALLAAGAFPSKSPSKLSTALGDSVENAPLPPSLQESTVEPGTPAAAVVEALRANRDKLIEYDPKVRANEWDSVHQMRVATRELRSHLETFHGIVEGPEIKLIEKELKDLAAMLGTARDAEVVEERWTKLLASEDSGVLDEATREHLAHDMGREYKRAHRHVIGALNSDRYLNLLEALDLLLLNPPVKKAEDEQAGSANSDTEKAAEAAETVATTATGEETSPEQANNSTVDAAEAAEASAEAASEEDKQADEVDEVDELDAEEAAAAAAAAAAKAEKKARKAALKEMDSVMAGHLAEAYEKLEKRHKRAVNNWDNEELSLHEREDYFHDMRKAAKKLRYAAEAAGSATSLDTKALYKACKDMQSVLGDFQDSVTSRDKLVELAAAAHRRGEDTFGYGLLYQRERYIGLEALEDYKRSFKAIKEAFKPLRRAL